MGGHWPKRNRWRGAGSFKAAPHLLIDGAHKYFSEPLYPKLRPSLDSPSIQHVNGQDGNRYCSGEQAPCFLYVSVRRKYGLQVFF